MDVLFSITYRSKVCYFGKLFEALYGERGGMKIRLLVSGFSILPLLLIFFKKKGSTHKIRTFTATVGVQPDVINVKQKLTPFLSMTSQDEPNVRPTSLSLSVWKLVILTDFEASCCGGGGDVEGVWNAVHTSYLFLYYHCWCFFFNTVVRIQNPHSLLDVNLQYE